MADESPSDPEQLPESIKCPICFELPLGKVFQCKDGHIICDLCFRQVSVCPQCRAAFGQDPIRCRAIEDMLAELKLTSGSSDQPCKDICKFFDYSNCSFIATGRNTLEVMKHLEAVHNWQVKELPAPLNFFFDFEDFARSFYLSEESPFYWNVFVNKHCNEFVLIFEVKYVPGFKAMSFTSFFLKYKKCHLKQPPLVKFSIYGSKGLNFKKFEFSLPSVDLVKAGETHHRTLIPVATLIKDYDVFKKLWLCVDL